MIRKASRLSKKIANIRNAFLRWKNRQQQRLSFQNMFADLMPQDSFLSRLVSAFRSDLKKGKSKSSARFDARKPRISARFEALEGRSMMAVDLSAGDIAFTGLQTDAPDSVSFVLLKNVDNTTSLSLTDNGWKTDQTGFANTTENTITLTFGSAYSAGTHFAIVDGGVPQFRLAGTTTSAGTVAGGSLNGLSASGDSVLAYQGAAPTAGNATNWIAGISSNEWGFSTSTNFSALPSALTIGSTAVGFTGGAVDIDNQGLSLASVTGDVGVIRAAVNNASNWTRDQALITLVPPATTFTVASSAATTTSLSSVTPLTANQGDSVTFQGTIVAGSGAATPVGTIQIRNGGVGGTLLASTTTIGGSGVNGTFSVSSSAIPTGTYSNLQAFFVAGVGFQSSNSTAFGSTLTVNAVGATTTTGLTGISPLTSAFGASVTFDGTVVAGSGSTTPAGTIEIRNGGAAGTLLASTTTIGGSGVNGTFSISTTSLPIGSYSNVQAFFSPSVGFQPSNSAVFGSSLTVNGISTTTSLASVSPLTTFAEQSVSFTGTIVAGSGAALPTGTVEIRDGSSAGTLLASTTSISGTGVNGAFSITSSSVPAGTYSNVRAYYVPTGNFALSNSAVLGSTLTVTAVIKNNLAAGDIAFTGYLGTATNERFSFVLLKDAAVGTQIVFTDNGWDGNATTPAYTTNEGTATLTLSQAFTAGSRIYYDAAAPAAFRNFDGTTTGLLTLATNGPGLSNSGDQITALQGTLAAPNANVASINTSAYLTTGAIATTTSYLPPGLTVGTSAISLAAATSNGTLNSADPDIGPAVIAPQPSILSKVNDLTNWTINTTTTLTVPPAVSFTVGDPVTTSSTIDSISPLTATTGQAITFTGLIVGGSGTVTPTGVVEIRDGGAAGTLLASTTTIGGSGANGTYNFSSTTVPAGTFSNIQAFFVGSGVFASSNSGTFGSTLAVSGVATTTTIGSISPQFANVGEAVVIAGTIVAGSGAATPVGTVEIRHGGATGTLLASTTTIGGTGANGTFSISSTTVPVGTFSAIQAFFVPGPGFVASNSSVFGSALTVASLVSYATAGSTYSQNFDTLPTAAVANTALTGQIGNGPFVLTAAPWSGSAMGGWYASKLAGSGASLVSKIDDGSSSGGSLNIYGALSATERALGSVGSSTSTARFGAIIRNDTGATLNTFTLNYVGEQWRGGGNTVPAANTLAFGYQFGATDIDNGTFLPSTDLTFSSINLATTATAYDGNLAANRLAKSSTISGFNWAPGQTLVIRWSDADDAGQDDGLAVDDFTFSAAASANSAPVITSANSANFISGQVGTFTVIATAVPAATFSATGLPAWLTLNTTTGVLTGTAPVVTATTPINLVITATNGVAPNATQNFTLSVLPTVVSYEVVNSNYTQNFDGLPSAGSFTLPATAGPQQLQIAPINATNMPGWQFAVDTATSPTDTIKFFVDNGGSSTGGVYTYGTTGAGERALGSVGSGSNKPIYGAVLVNNTAQTLSQFTLAYTGEQWRRGSAAANVLDFSYAIGDNTTTVSNGTFTEANQLDFTAPNNQATASVAIDGNAVGNKTAVTGTVTGVSWAPGQTLVIRWKDADDSGNDDGVSIDDLTFSANVFVATAPTITSRNSINFEAGISNSFTVTATGAPAPTFTAATLPAWLSLDANTGVLTGTPPAVTVATPITFTITAANGTAPNATQSFTLTSVPSTIAYATSGSSYSQNFDGLPNSGTFTLASTGPINPELAPVNANGVSGWSFAKSSGTGTVARFIQDTGLVSAGSVYSYGANAGTDRALGSTATSALVSSIGSVFTNTSGVTMTNFTVSFTGEQWRRGDSATANTLAFEYGLGATNLITGTFVPVTQLNFTSPNVSTTTTNVALDGNAVANQTAVTFNVTGITWAPGQTLALRWTDADDTGNDDGLAIDNLSFTASNAAGNTAPTITSGSTASFAENGTGTAYTITATDSDVPAQTLTYSISGTDAARFNVNSTTGAVSFITPPNFELPTDAGANNVYDITVAVTDGVATTTKGVAITVTDVPEVSTLGVSSFTANTSSFAVRFNQALDVTRLNLVDSNNVNGVSDFTVIGAASGAIRGSVILDADSRGFTFIRTGGVLPVDTYTVTLRSATNGFVTAGGALLDGNSDGTAGDDYSAQFTVTAPASGTVTVGVADFVRGYGQSVNLPATGTAGIPITLSTGINVAGTSFTLRYDPTLLTITAGTTPIVGASISVNTDVAGQVTIAMASENAFATVAGVITIANLVATVPTTAPRGSKAILDLTNVTVSAVDTNTLPSIADDGIQIASYRGDVNNSGSITTGDVTGLLRTISGALSTSGFPSLKLADPILVGDMNDSSSVTTGDVTGLLRFISGAAGGFAAIPAIPAGLALPPAGPDPVIFIPTNLTATAGSSVVVPVHILVTEPSGVSLAGFDVRFTYDSTRFTFGSASLGSALAGFTFSSSNNTATPGVVRLVYASDVGPSFANGFTGILANVTLNAIVGAAAGTSAVNITASAASDNDTADLVILPPALPGADSNDGAITIAGGANSAPTNITLSNASVAENAGANATVGSFTTTDPDAGNTHTYTLVSGTGADDNASFNISGGSLRATSSLDFETKSSYTVRVRTTDQGGEFFEKAFTISVTDVVENSAPTDIALSNSTVAENAGANATVGSFTTTDTVGDTHTYTLVSGTGADDNAAFNISVGTLRATSSLDFETKSSYTVRVRTTDAGGLFFEKAFTISVTNVNEAPTIAPQTFSVAENSANGTAVGTVAAADVDAGDTRTFAITAGNTSGAFAINATTGAITVANTTALDFETTPSFALTVSVTDAGSLSASNTVTINLTDVNEDPIYINEIYWNPQGTDGPNEYFELRGTPGATIAAGTYLLGIEGDAGVPNPGDVQNIFDVSGRTFGSNGLILFLQKGATYNTTAAAAAGTTIVTNAGTGAGWGSGTTSSIGHSSDSSATDIENGAVTFMLIRSSTAPVATDDIDSDDNGTPNGSVFAGWTVLDSIGALQSTALNDLTYAAVNIKNGTGPGTSTTGPVTPISGEVEYAARFVGANGMTAAAWLAGDAIGSAPSFRLVASAANLTDGAYRGAALDHIGLPNNFTLVAPTDLALSATSVSENVAAGSTVGTFTTTDPTAGDTHTYTLVAGTGSTDNAAFTIVGNALNINASPNFEVKSSYSIRVRTTDVALNTFEKEFTISVTDLNEAPVFGSASYTFSVPENSVSGSVVGTAGATDPDAGAVLVYSLSGPGASNFAISSTGEITVAAGASLDFETTNSYALIVGVSSEGGLAASAPATINLTNVNESPVFGAASYSFSIAENSAAATAVGSVSATDPDAPAPTLVYSLSGTGSSNFAIDASGSITVAAGATLNFETTPSFSLTVEVSDGSLTTTAPLTIALSNVNEAPLFNPDTVSYTVAENAANGVVVGTVTAVDPDAGDTLSYSITGGNGTGTGAFAINATTGQIAVADTAQMSAQTYTVTVDATDALGLVDTITVTISVSANIAPSFGQASYTFSLAENSTAASPVGTVTATDPELATLTYSLSGPGASNFVINSATGAITVAAGATLDFEGTNSYSLTASVSDGFLSSTAPVTINLTNVNEAPTIAAQTFSIAENSANGSAVGTVVAADIDAGDTKTFAITAGNASGAFAINPSTGAITVADATALNFETTPSFALTVSVTDAGSLSASNTVTVDLTNVNEAPTIAAQTFSIAENSANGSAVGTVVAADVDAGDTKTFAITAGNASGAFAINASTGAITVADAAALNFETTPSFALTVSVTDAGTLSASNTVTVNLTNVNEVPTIAAQTFSIAENSANGSAVGTVVAADVDAGDTKTFAITAGNASGAFAINAITGAITVADATALNFETTPSFALTVSVTDAGTLSASNTVTVNLTNVNEGPVFGAASYSFSLTENAAAATAFGNVSATDPDAATTLVYSLSGTGSSNFAISASGAITVAAGATLNFETTPSYSLTVMVSDGTLSATAPVTISLTNVNEVPTFGAGSYSFSLAENSAAATAVGSVSATDPDAATTLTYSLSGTGSSNFAISATGAITVAAGATLNFETTPSYSLTVTASDGTLSATAPVTISLTNVNEAPVFGAASYSFSIAENSAAATAVGSVSATDPDAATTLVYSLSGAGSSNFAISASGAITVAAGATLNFEATPSIVLTATASDGSLSATVPVTISLTDVNDAPTDILLSDNRIADNATAGTVVGTVSGVDQDAGSTFTFALSGTDAASFTLVGTSLQASAAYNGSQATYSIDVTVTDNGGLTFTKTFTINRVAGANQAPTNIILTGNTVAENSSVGTTLGTLQAVDPNPNNTFTFSLVPGAGSTNNSAFAISGTSLELASVPNFEANSSYSIRVRVTDQGGLSFDRIFTINVTNVNEAPTDINLSSSSVAINAAAGTVVGSLSTVDPDAGSVFTYSLTGADAGKFTIVGNSLRVGATALNGTQTSYSLSITSSDGSLSYTEAFTIGTVAAPNSAPTNILLSGNTIAENSAIGTLVGTLSATDDQATGHTFALVSGAGSTNNASFAISGTSLNLATIPNFEASSSYSARIRVTDGGGLSYDRIFTINITNVNEAPTDINLSGSTVAINAAAGTVVGTLSTIDPDAGSVFSYTLSGTDASKFTIVGSSLRTAVALDGIQTNYSISITSSDGSLTYLEAFSIGTVVASNTAPTNITLTTNSVPENTASGTLIGSLGALDANQASGHTFAFASGAGSTDNASFAIVGTSLNLATVPDFEAKSSYSIRVRVTDAGGLTFDKVFSINVTNVNESPTNVNLSNSTVAINAAAGTVVGNLSTVDPDSGNTFSYVVGGADASRFVVVGSSLRVGATALNGTTASYSITVTTTDQGGLTFTRAFTIGTASAPNTAPTNITLSSTNVVQNSPAGTVIGTLGAVDANQASGFTFALVAGAGSTDNATFTIVNGELRLNTSIPSRATKASYVVRIRVTDAGGLSFDKIFGINVTL